MLSFRGPRKFAIEQTHVDGRHFGRLILVAGPAEELSVTEVICGDVVWRGGAWAEVAAQVRYRQGALPAIARVHGDRLALTFREPLAGVAPGQAAVCYNGEVVLGGGVVEEAR